MRLFWAVLAAILVQASAAAASPAPLVSIVTLRAHMGAWANRTVRVRGQLDLCHRYTCNLCPEDMTPASYETERCLSVSFASPEAGSIGGRRARAMDDTYRFATVTLEATFDPSCLGYVPKAHRTMVGEIVCFDRASVLRHSRVLAVRGRKTANDGLIAKDATILHLIPASQEVEHAVLATYAEAVPSEWGDDKVERAVFIVDPTDAADISKGLQALAEVCTCREDRCDGRWPTRLLTSEADPYVCQDMAEWDGRWRVIPLH